MDQSASSNGAAKGFPMKRCSRRTWALLPVLAFALLGTLVLAACGSSVETTSETTGDQLKIGFIVPATGPVSSTGLAMQTGFEIAVAEVNEDGGVNGKPITYEIQDDGGDPARSTQIARRYTQDSDVDMLFGTITGDTAAAVVAVAEEAKLPFATAILGDSSRPSTFAWAFGESNMQLLIPMVKSLVEDYGPRIAYIGSDYNFPHDFAAAAKGVIADNGAELVAEEYSPLGTTDFESTIGRLADSNPDAILSYVVGSDAVTFTQQAAAFGLLTPEIGYEGAPLDSDYYPANAAQVEGREHVVRWADGLDNPDSKAFVEAYRAKTGSTDPIPEVAANAYFGLKFIAAALNEAGAASSDKIQEALGSFSFDSPLGKDTHFITDDAGNHLFQANMRSAKIVEGVYEIVTDHGMLEGVAPARGAN